MRIQFVLAGLHRAPRGAEVAFESVATELARLPATDVGLLGSGPPRPDAPYRYRSRRAVSREHFERWPSLPHVATDYIYEEFTFCCRPGARFIDKGADVTVTCSYPFVNWRLRRGPLRRKRPKHVFVTQNGDYPAHLRNAMTRGFGCDGLVCTNPVYYERNKDRWRAALIPNGIDVDRFRPGPSSRSEFGLPSSAPIVLMVSALVDTKRVDLGVRAVASHPEAHLVVAGDGPLRSEIDRLAAELMPGRFHRFVVPPERMPALYRSADVFLHTTRLESFGNVYIEALACGLPIVAEDDPVTRWIFEGRATLVDCADAEMLGHAVRRSIHSGPIDSSDTDYAHRRFAWGTVAKQYLEFFGEVLAS